MKEPNVIEAGLQAYMDAEGRKMLAQFIANDDLTYDSVQKLMGLAFAQGAAFVAQRNLEAGRAALAALRV